jgi:hypothetical protein
MTLSYLQLGIVVIVCLGLGALGGVFWGRKHPAAATALAGLADAATGKAPPK